MKVSTTKPFQIIYSLYAHEYLGYLFESFVVQLDDSGRLSFLHQNISAKNADEFTSGLDERDYELIKLMDSMQQEAVIKKFYAKKIKPNEFFLKVYDKEKGNKPLQEEIERYLERKRAQVLEYIHGKMLFEMGNDGEPAWRAIEIMPEKATVLFHFRRNETNTHYFPTIKYAGEKLEWQYKGAYLICREPAWLVLNNRLYSFQNEVDGKKLQPFLNKKFIEIPKKVEDMYYRKFVAPLIAQFDVYAKGFSINSLSFEPRPLLTFSELDHMPVAGQDLYSSNGNGNGNSNGNGKDDAGKIVFNLSFRYGEYIFKAEQLSDTSVRVEQQGDEYTFHKVKRRQDEEKAVIRQLRELGMELRHARATHPKAKAFSWLSRYRNSLENQGYLVQQNKSDEKRYFLGQAHISIEVKENIDWFDIYAIIRFGEYEISFNELRKYILRKQHEIKLPNGEIAVIPEQWLHDYSELFAFSEEGKNGHKGTMLRKHHLALVQDLQSGNLAKVTISHKLEKLRSFQEIEDYPMPSKFLGDLRPYQKAGYNWLQFLNKYNFGGCLADDMGLGKTVQTLAMLQAQKEAGKGGSSLLVMPTSLIYNWEMEARKFTPGLRVHVYTGTNRNKDVSRFQNYDLILTSYGITRLDIEELKKYYFNYIILDESQAIKNPTSNIARAVRELNCRHRLILTGTPLENSTLDLWSQMHFINPGLLGNQSFFKNEFLNPIEKKQDEDKITKLYTIIKPFILRRKKTQVATELPEKIENVQYCSMTAQQEEKYEEAKNYYRSMILDQIDLHGVKKSQFMLLQGLTKLRQIANHPAMVDEGYTGDSGKMQDVTHMLQSAVSKGHNILIFSQFVKQLGIFRKYLDKHKLAYAYLDGATKDRMEQVQRFQTDDKLQLFLISLKAGGVGLNLTKADYVFILDPWWNPAAEQQAIDRAHRIGQENRVFTYKFITRNTVEEKILALQQQKVQLAHNLITTEESFVKNLSKEDINSLLA